ncbi:hypothetical protein HY491_01275 [Candidatus Woesearchaeota archaeon]|nr:hypothetical protein [Candidatus Woesearchaeota archaeon]
MDIQVFNILPQKVRKAIARNHKVLYKRTGYDNVRFSVQHLKYHNYEMRVNQGNRR